MCACPYMMHVEVSWTKKKNAAQNTVCYIFLSSSSSALSRRKLFCWLSIAFNIRWVLLCFYVSQRPQISLWPGIVRHANHLYTHYTRFIFLYSLRDFLRFPFLMRKENYSGSLHGYFCHFAFLPSCRLVVRAQHTHTNALHSDVWFESERARAIQLTSHMPFLTQHIHTHATATMRMAVTNYRVRAFTLSLSLSLTL